jgi:hypothetical protein
LPDEKSVIQKGWKLKVFKNVLVKNRTERIMFFWEEECFLIVENDGTEHKFDKSSEKFATKKDSYLRTEMHWNNLYDFELEVPKGQEKTFEIMYFLEKEFWPYSGHEGEIIPIFYI